MYLSVVVSLFYPAVCYVFYLTYQALTNSPNISFNVPEFNEFFKDVEPQALAIALPSIAAAWAYIMTRVKFAFFDEGDLEQLGWGWNAQNVDNAVNKATRGVKKGESAPMVRREKNKKKPSYSSSEAKDDKDSLFEFSQEEEDEVLSVSQPDTKREQSVRSQGTDEEEENTPDESRFSGEQYQVLQMKRTWMTNHGRWQGSINA